MQNHFNHFHQKYHFFDAQTASRIAFFVILFALIALWAVPIGNFSLLEPFRILHLAHDLCIFSLLSPVSENDRMHHTYIFVNFVVARWISLPFLQYIIYFSLFCKIVLAAYTGSTFFKNNSKQLALKNASFELLFESLAPSVPPRRTLIRQ